MLDPAVGVLLTGCCALLFAGAAQHKLRSPGLFAAVLRAYRVVPDAAVRFASLVPLAELAVALTLLVPATRPRAALTGMALLVLYALAIAVNLGRGRRDLACGCGGPDEARPIASWMVARNLLLAVLLGLTLVPWQDRTLVATDVLTVGAGIAVATLLYASLERLLGRVVPRGAALAGPR